MVSKGAKGVYEFFHGADLARKEISKTILLNPSIQVTEKGLQHTLKFHGTNAVSKLGGKSIFNSEANLLALIDRGAQQPMVLAQNGRYIRTYDAGFAVGRDCVTGQITTTVTIVTEQDGRLVTMHPGFPRGG